MEELNKDNMKIINEFKDKIEKYVNGQNYNFDKSDIKGNNIVYYKERDTYVYDNIKDLKEEDFEKIYDNSENFYDMVDIIEYPTHDMIFGLDLTCRLQPGIGFSYVSNTYLNGIINYLDKILYGFSIRRYTSTDDVEKEKEKEYHDYLDWIDSCKTIENQIDEPHSNFQTCKDDIMIVGKVRDEYEKDNYIFFWFDKDVSDCVICITDKIASDKEAIDTLFRTCIDEVIDDYMYDLTYKEFIKYAFNNKKCDITNFIYPIRPELFRGWVKF